MSENMQYLSFVGWQILPIVMISSSIHFLQMEQNFL
jgi:hypothetical protein